MKKCSKCGETKPMPEFSKLSNARDGLRPNCKACAAKYRAENAHKIKEYRDANADKRSVYGAAYYAANKEKINARAADHYAENKERIGVRQAGYVSANKEKINARLAKYYAANKERLRVRAAEHSKANGVRRKAYYEANKEKMVAKMAEYYKANAHLFRIYSQNRRARKLANGGRLSKGLASRLFKLQRGKCPCCNLPLGDDYHLDHVVPLALGGQNVDSNIQLLRAACNRSKQAKHPVDFMQSRGFLL